MLKAPPYDAQADAHAAEGYPANGEGAKDFDEKMLQAVALGNLPLSFVELAPLQAALQKLRPSVELPSRCAVGGRILNDAAAAADAEADAELRRSKHGAHARSDGTHRKIYST